MVGEAHSTSFSARFDPDSLYQGCSHIIRVVVTSAVDHNLLVPANG
jgi:hypothetical protein